MTRVIGLTGGIGSGKSTISQYLAELGAVVIDADKIGHQVFQPGTGAWRDVVATFGQQVVAPGGEIDRKKLGEIVFNDPESMTRLNEIMHPRMYQMAEEQIEQYRRQGVPAVVLEAAILIEAGWTPLVDEVWVVTVSEKAVVKRLKEQRGLDEEQTLSRIRSQMQTEERIKHADIVISNDADLSKVKARVKELWDRLQK